LLSSCFQCCSIACQSMPSLPLTHQHQALQHSYPNSNCLPCHISGQANNRPASFTSANCILQLRHGPDLITGLPSRCSLVTMINGIVRPAPAPCDGPALPGYLPGCQLHCMESSPLYSYARQCPLEGVTVYSMLQRVADCACLAAQERKHRHKHHKHREASEEAGGEGEGGDSGEKKRRHRKKREEEGADAV